MATPTRSACCLVYVNIINNLVTNLTCDTQDLPISGMRKAQTDSMNEQMDGWMVSSAGIRAWALLFPVWYSLYYSLLPLWWLHKSLLRIDSPLDHKLKKQRLKKKKSYKSTTHRTALLIRQEIIHEMRIQANHRTGFTRLFWKQMHQKISQWLKK